MMNKKYWIERANAYGHTGWSDQIIYFYDQKLRMCLVERLIKKYFPNGLKISLDYGCGSGEFTNLLANYSEQAIGVDLADEILVQAIKNNKDNTFFYSLDMFDIKSKKYSMITAITVFQHILEENALEALLLKLYNSLEDNGMMIIIDSYGNNFENEYMKQRDFQSFLKLLEKVNLTVLETYNLYHPQEYPTKLFKMYRNNICVRMLNRLNLKYPLQKISSYIASYDSALIPEESMVKIVVLTKKIGK